MSNNLPPKPGFTEMSIVAQLIMCGLVARYGSHDPEGLAWARQALSQELREKGWVLPPFRLDGETESSAPFDTKAFLDEAWEWPSGDFSKTDLALVLVPKADEDDRA